MYLISNITIPQWIPKYCVLYDKNHLIIHTFKDIQIKNTQSASLLTLIYNI